MPDELTPDPPESSDPNRGQGAAHSGSRQGGFARFWVELKRRKVMRVAITYAVVAWLVIQVAVATFPYLLIPEWALRLVIMLVILGFPVSLIIAWAFELTPEGIKTAKVAREKHSEESVSKKHQQTRNWFWLLFGAAIPTLLFGSLALFFYIRLGGDFEVDKSIAVLPFDNRSNLEEDLFFTDGIHDELLTQVSKISDIRTVSRTSVEVYRDSPKNMRTIGEELEVGVILEGGVQRVGGQVRINVQLIDAATDAHLWAEIYNREMTVENLFAIQSEIAVTIAEKLKAVISPEEQQRIEKLPTESLEALEAYFEAREIVELDIVTRRPEAIALLEKAITLDPEFSLAYEWLGRAKFPNRNLSDEAEAAVLQALERDPQLDSSHAFLGEIRSQNRDAEGARTAYEQALAINPNNVEAFLGLAYVEEGELDIRDPESVQRTLRSLERAISLDPQNFDYRRRLGFMLQKVGRFPEAQAHFEKALELQPGAPQTHEDLGIFYAYCLGRFDLAIQQQRKVMALDPERYFSYHMMFEYHNRIDESEEAKRWADVRIHFRSGDGFVKNSYRIVSARWIYPDDEERWIEPLRDLLDRNPRIYARQLLIETELRNGRLAEARAFYETHFPFLFADTLDFYDEPDLREHRRMDRADAAAELAEIERRSGNLDRAALLADASWDYWRHFPRMGWRSVGSTGYGLNDVLVHTIKGDKRQALDSLREAVQAGFRSRVELNFPWFDPLRDKPEFAKLIEIMENDIAAQLENVRRMEASGELAALPAKIREFLEEVSE